MMFVFVCFEFAGFVITEMASPANGFTFLWNNSEIGRITIDFFPDIAEKKLILPIFFISLLTILNNCIFRYEEKKSAFNALVLLNLIVLSLLVCSENYIQLITSVFVSDILGYLLLKDVDASRRYVIYNFIADMCLFMILALARSQIQSLNLNDFSHYAEVGRHKDFVGMVIALALFVKTGAAFFHGYLLDLSSARFQRMTTVNLLYSPLSGILLLIKLSPLLSVSSLSLPLIRIVEILSFVFGMIGFIVIDNIQKKVMYLNMSFWALLFLMLVRNNFILNNTLSLYFVSMFFFNLLFFKIYLYQNRENKVSVMLNSSVINSLTLKSVLLLFIMLAGLYAALMLKIAFLLKMPAYFFAAVFILAGIAVVLNHIYRSPHSRRLDYLNPNPLRFLSFLINFSLFAIAAVYLRAWHEIAIVVMLAFMGIVFSPDVQKSRWLYEKEFLQNKELNKMFFEKIITEPLLYVSRQLLLTIDFVFSEKMITAAFSSLNRLGLSLFFKVNQKSFAACVIFILFGMLVFALSFIERAR